MKKLIFILLTFLSFSAFCQTPSPKFTDAYADRLNPRVTNLIIKSPSGTVEIHHSGAIVDSSAVNNFRMQQYVQNQLSGFTSIDSARVYDSLAVHRDSIDAISSYTHGLSQNFWPLTGNFSIPTQTITLTGNTSFQRGGINQFRLTSVLNDFRTPDGLNILSFTNALTTYTAGNGIPLRYGSAYSIGNDLDIIHKGYADANVRGLSIPVTTSQAGNSIRIDGSGTQWEYYTPSSGGVNEAYVATSIDSVDNANEIGYTPATTGDWPNADPTTVQGGLDSLAERVTYIEGILPGIIDTVNLGSWDMSSSGTLNVTLPVTNANLIAVLDVVIFHDNGTVSVRKWNRVSSAGTVDIGASDLQTLSSTTFQLVRGTDGYFDANGTFYDDTGVNRGYMVIFYRE